MWLNYGTHSLTKVLEAHAQPHLVYFLYLQKHECEALFQMLHTNQL